MEDGDQTSGFGSSARVILGACRQLAFLGFGISLLQHRFVVRSPAVTPPIASKGVALENLPGQSLSLH